MPWPGAQPSARPSIECVLPSPLVGEEARRAGWRGSGRDEGGRWKDERILRRHPSSFLTHPSRTPHPALPPRGEGRNTRRVLEAVDAPLPRQRLGLMPGGRIVVTEDGRGVAEALASRLEAVGVRAERVGGRDRPVEWTSPAAIDSVLDELRSRGPIAGIVHALPLGQATSGDPGGPCWSERVGDAVKGLFLLAKATAADLEAAARAGGSCLIAATAMGGRFAAAGTPAPSSSPARRRRGAGQDPGPRVAGRPLPGGGPRDGGAMPRPWPAGWPTRCSPAMAGPRSATTGTAGSACIPSRGRCADADAAIELKPGEPVRDHGRCPRDHGPGGGRAGADLAADAPDRRHHAAARRDRDGRHGGPRRRGRDQGRAARPAPPGGPAGAARPRSRRLTRRSAAPAKSARTWRSCARRGRPSNTPAPMSATPTATGRRPRRLARAGYGDPVGLIHGAGLIKDKLIREKTLESFDRVLGHEARRRAEPAPAGAPRGPEIHGDVLVDRRPVRQRGPVGLCGGQRDPQQAGPVARPSLARSRGVGDLGALVGRGHGLAAREPPGPPRAGDDRPGGRPHPAGRRAPSRPQGRRRGHLHRRAGDARGAAARSSAAAPAEAVR